MTAHDATHATRAVHVLVFDGFADWEPAHALAGLRRWAGRTVRTVGFTRDPVVSMGGLTVTPETDLSSVRAADVELLILPGGDMWEGGSYPRERLDPLLASLVSRATPVAAICAATVAVARAGLLEERSHTSNGRAYLAEHAAQYAGAAHYVDELAVRDAHVITASGLGSVDFARAIFAELGAFSESDQQMWYDMHKHGRMPQPG